MVVARVATGTASGTGNVSIIATGMMLPSPLDDPAQFTQGVLQEFGRLQQEISAVRSELIKERGLRESAVRDLSTATRQDLDGLVARVRDLDLSGLRWQVVGIFFVVVGVVGDLISR